MEDTKTAELRDYTVLLLRRRTKGTLHCIRSNDEEKRQKFDFFDMDFKHLPFRNGHPNAAEMRKSLCALKR